MSLSNTPLLLSLSAGILAAQPFTIGVKGGGVPTNDLNNSFDATSESKRYIAGPMVTARLPFGFRLEFDALYQRVGFRSAGSSVFSSFTERDRGNSWEFPIIVRRQLRRGLYVGVGYEPRVINGSGHIDAFSVSAFNLALTYSEYNVPGSWSTTQGVVGAAGIETHLGPVHIAPEVRYIHWTSPALESYGPQGYAVVSTQDEVQFMVGISFP